MYILRISSKAFIQVKPDEVVIISDYEKATRYNTIGEAMKVASELNELINTSIIKVIKYD